MSTETDEDFRRVRRVGAANFAFLERKQNRELRHGVQEVFEAIRRFLRDIQGIFQAKVRTDISEHQLY